jgi:hypothetical protein
MKKLIFTFLPLVAAVLFATTSCNKDDNDNNEVAQDKTVSVTFTANVGESSGLSKITVDRGEKGFTCTWEGEEEIKVSCEGGNPTVKKTTLDKDKLTIEVEGLPANWTSVTFTVGSTELSGNVSENNLSFADLGGVKRTATVPKEDIADFTFDFPYAVVYNSSSTNPHTFYYKNGEDEGMVEVAAGKVRLVTENTEISKSQDFANSKNVEAGKSYVLKD